MERLIDDFSNNIFEALLIAGNVQLTAPTTAIRNVVICGMGGSGIGGNLVSGWLANELKVPVDVIKDYQIPAFVDAHTLLIASSYSGNTEETLACVQDAIRKGAQITAVCSGGALFEWCTANQFDVIKVPGGNPPRTALAFSLVQLLAIFHKKGLASSVGLDQIKKAGELIQCEKEGIQSEAKKLAAFLKGKVPVLYATSAYEPVLIRARQQFNENSKVLCWQHVIPEMNHNELVGWGGGDDRFAVVFFMNQEIHPRNEKRLEITAEKILDRTKQVFFISSKGSNLIERSIYLIHLVDWASYYLAELKQVDSMDISVIDYLKDSLASFEG